MHGLPLLAHRSLCFDGLRILVTRRSGLQYDRDSPELSLSAVESLPINIYAGDTPLKGSVHIHELLVLLFDKLID